LGCLQILKSKVCTSPNLKDWNCAAEEMSGNQKITDVSSEPYMHDKKYIGAEFDFKKAGHYYCDVAPDKIEYECYFNTANEIYRVNNIYNELTGK